MFHKPLMRLLFCVCVCVCVCVCRQIKGVVCEADVSPPCGLRAQGGGAAVEEGLLRGHPGHQDQQEGTTIRQLIYYIVCDSSNPVSCQIICLFMKPLQHLCWIGYPEPGRKCMAVPISVSAGCYLAWLCLCLCGRKEEHDIFVLD